MRRTLILLVVVLVAVLVAWGQVPVRELDGTSGTGGANSTPVDVTNFPIDADGNLLTVVPVANRVIDLLDDLVTGDWESEVFSTGPFNWIALQVSESAGGGSCEVQWQLTLSDPFFGIESTNGATTPPMVLVRAFPTLQPDLTGLAHVQAPRGKVVCNIGSEGLSDAKVLLRRE